MPSVTIPRRDLVNAMRACRSWRRLIHDRISDVVKLLLSVLYYD